MSDWATTDKPKTEALAAASKIEALAAQHTWLVAENSTLREHLAEAVSVLEQVRDAPPEATVADIRSYARDTLEELAP